MEGCSSLAVPLGADPVVHLSRTGDMKKGEREPGDIIIVEHRRVLVFYEVTERCSVRFVTSMSRFAR